jgi:hypothetical protein
VHGRGHRFDPCDAVTSQRRNNRTMPKSVTSLGKPRAGCSRKVRSCSLRATVAQAPCPPSDRRAVRRLACAPRRAPREGLCPLGAGARLGRPPRTGPPTYRGAAGAAHGHTCRWLRFDPTGARRKMGRGDVLLGPHEQGIGGIGTMGIRPDAPYGPCAFPPREGDVAVIPIKPCFSAGGFVLTGQEGAGKMGCDDLLAGPHVIAIGGIGAIGDQCRCLLWSLCFPALTEATKSQSRLPDQGPAPRPYWSSIQGCARRWLRPDAPRGSLVDLIRDGLATGRTEHLVIAGHTTEVMRVRITEAGRRALAR